MLAKDSQIMWAMSVMGQERTYWRTGIMSAFGGKADVIGVKADILCVAGTARQIGGLLNRLHSRFYAALSPSNLK